uniref:Uncharacterized protein n=1 Tax=Arundo donax TaxID=35708 RepID=A0A0A9CY95_ARUDO
MQSLVYYFSDSDYTINNNQIIF